ncbi:DNA polymerase III subunit chi [Pseudomonas frederiksbergensis]|uniref:DNA polymerase III subunit chi n=1 Tax=Pseudomonas frederiksbergensis TaxID=104087 RepID=A0A1J0EIB2_9PSED|nr:DNA polymerase III subunit chi [Pseudomonas frederiksbergensis]APC15793.1 DNA polymerase III subunit chi [Pseudomonas frederiksbergensis]
MDTSNPLQKSVHLLDDLESIRQLLGDDNLQPPLLTDTVEQGSDEGQIPMLFDQVGGKPRAEIIEPPAPTPTPAPAPVAAPAPASSVQQGADVMLHLNDELRAAAQLIMQDVIDDFAPHIETEIKRRLDARMERLLSHYE